MARVGFEPMIPMFERKKYLMLYILVGVRDLYLLITVAALRHEPSSPARTLGSWVRIPLEEWMSVCFYSLLVFCVCVGSGFAKG
jgi:hypothetical protein